MADAYNFQFLPLEGRLPGRDFEQQTEDAINDIGNRLVSAEETLAETSTVASEAYKAATEAQTSADTAQTTADNATALANAAQATADSATTLANAAQTTTDGKAPIYHASETTAYGLGSDTLFGHVMLSDAAGESDASGGVAVTPLALQSVDNNIAELASRVAEDSAAMAVVIEKAQSTADSAQEAADAAITQSAANTSSINSLRESVSMLTAYEPVGAVDLNDYEEYARLYIIAGSANAPSSDEAFFVDVDAASGSGIVRQTAVSLADSSVYIRWGTEPDADAEAKEVEEVEENEETEETEEGEENEEPETEETELIWSEWQLANVEYATDEQVEAMLDEVFGE